MKIMNRLKRLLETGLILIPLAFNFSCAFFENDVADYMEKYTETAAIEQHKFDPYEPYKDLPGNDCINSKQDFEITLTMRNPKKYALKPSVTFKNLLPSVDVSRVTIKQVDTYTLSLKFPQEFLLDADEGKDITASIGLEVDDESHRKFEGYEIPLHCNTVPPQVQNATIMNNNNETFVICFDMPDAEELAIRHKDIVCLTVNGDEYKEYPVSIAADGSFTFEDTCFSDTPKETYSKIDSKDFANSGRSVYFETNDVVVSGEKSYTLGLKDKAGLIQTVYINTEISRLSRPEIKDIDGVIYTTGANEMVAGSENDPYKLTITPPATDHKGNNVGETTIHYELYKGPNTVSALIQGQGDESENPVTISLTEGTYCLKTYATKLNYEQSALTTVILRVVDSAIYVDENNGSDDDLAADGTREHPFKTLQKAIADVDQRNMPDAKLNIYIAGTLEETAVVNLEKAKELTISARPGATATLDARDNGPALTIDTAVPVIIKNITIKNGSAENGGAVLMKDGTELTLGNGAVLTQNTAANNGGAVYVPLGAKLSVCNGAVIKENTAGANGGGIYVSSGASFEITEGAAITQNTAAVNGGGVYAGSNLTLSGAIKINGNTNTLGDKSNLYIPQGIKLIIAGSLSDSDSGSKSDIGISTQATPTIITPVTITQDYGYNGGHNSGVIPGTYFTGDCYAISYDSTADEAVVAVNGGSITDVINSQQITFSVEENWFSAGDSSDSARTIRINPTIKVQGTDVTEEVLAAAANPVTWKADLYINGHLVQGCSFTSLEFVVPQSVGYRDIYTLHVQATWNGMTYDDEFTVYGYDPS